MLRTLPAFRYGGQVFTRYTCDEPGDELPLHGHRFNHLTVCTAGEIECFNAEGRSVVLRPGDAPVEYEVGQRHGIRALTPGAAFLNISPLLEG